MSVRLSFDPAEIDLDLVHAFLSGAYWSPGIPRATLERGLANSLCVAAIDEENEQIGFARVVTDRATFAYLADVFVLPAHRGEGIARAMVEALHAHPDLQGLRRWLLMTRDMQPLYAKLGWTPLARPENAMERHFPKVYEA